MKMIQDLHWEQLSRKIKAISRLTLLKDLKNQFRQNGISIPNKIYRMSSRPKNLNQEDKGLDWAEVITHESEVEEHKDGSQERDAYDTSEKSDSNYKPLKMKREALSRDTKAKTLPKRKPWMI